MVSNTLPKLKQKKYTPEFMAIAFEMMRSGMIGRKAPARSYDVPKTVLLEKLSKRVPEELTSLGRKTIRGGDEKKNLKKPN